MNVSNFVSILLILSISPTNCQNPEVEIPQGMLRGGVRKNIDGSRYYSFQNIPYAEPPIGELRFKAPIAADAWEGTRDATKDLPSCVQQGNIMGQEDCLYLNIYTPGLPKEDITDLPVMVWIHGGGFYAGSAKETMYGAQFLLTRSVILVAINYRLGIFGFLSLDDPNLGVTGNAGMKDQVLALEWVQDNIEYFGGDPNNVLIFGEDAGSTSVQLLILSPMAKGLFHKAISQSGDALTELLKAVPRNNAKAIAKALGIEAENLKLMLMVLQTISADDLASAELRFHTDIYRYFTAPIVEISSNNPAFLHNHPLNIMRSGNYNQVPFIIGINEADGLLFQFTSAENTGEPLFIDDFSKCIPSEFMLVNETERLNLSEILKETYYGGTEPSKYDISEAVSLTTDYAFAFPSYRTVKEYLKTATNDIYFYYFTAITGLNYFKWLDDTIAEFPGAAHADDLGYLFHMSVTPSYKAGSPEERSLRNIINLWTNFAIYGNPTPEGVSDYIWAPVRKNHFNYLHIGTHGSYLIRDSVFTEEKMEFWSSLYEEYTAT